MSQIKRNSGEGMGRNRTRRTRRGPRIYYLPASTARAVTLFCPACESSADVREDELLAVELLEYGIVTFMVITSVSRTPFSVHDVIINGEFHPFLTAAITPNTCSPEKLFFSIPWPVIMNCGSSFFAVIQAPAAADGIQKHCYQKITERLMVSTNRGDFNFQLSETILYRDPAVTIV